MTRLIYHVALEAEWEAALAHGDAFRRSTRGKSLDEVGFIHCSFAEQVDAIAHLLYQGRSDVVLLTIDASRLEVEVRVENLEGGSALFPHIYGPLPFDAVVRVERVSVSEGSPLIGVVDDDGDVDPVGDLEFGEQA